VATLEEMQEQWAREEAEALREARVRALELLASWGFTEADGWSVEPAGQDGARVLVRVSHPQRRPVVLKFVGHEAAPLEPFVVVEPRERAGQWVGAARDVVTAMRRRRKVALAGLA
jgi:hypothetical protein